MKIVTMFMLSAVIFPFSMGIAQNKAKLAAAKPEMAVNVSGPRATWDKTTEEMGDIPQNVPRVAAFNLTNDGNEPLLISSAQASCGCTNLVYSREPLLPGKSTSVTATYNAAAKGPFMKTITVRTNAGDPATVLQIKGNVQEKPAGQKP